MKDKPIISDKRSSNEPKALSSASNQQWVGAVVGEHLDERVENLDFNVTARLSAARHRALAQATESVQGEIAAGAGFLSWADGWRKWSIAGSGLAAAVVIAVVLVKLLPSESMLDAVSETNELATLDTTNRTIEDMQMLSAGDELEFFKSLEFLEWIESNAG